MALGVITTVLSFALSASSLCPYEDISGDVLVADATCRDDTICIVDSSCIVSKALNNGGNPRFRNVNAIGNMRFYQLDTLNILDSKSVTIKEMELPPALTTLSFVNVSQIDLDYTSFTKWDSLEYLHFASAKNIKIPTNIQWPKNLQEIVFEGCQVSSIPTNFPSTLVTLGMQGNGIEDINSLPSGVTLPKELGLEQSPDHHRQRLASVYISDAIVKSKASHVRQCPALIQHHIFVRNLRPEEVLTQNKSDIGDCPALKNITIDEATYTALNALPPYDGKADNPTGYNVTNDVATNEAACVAQNGQIKALWKSSSKYLVNVCVKSSSAPTEASSNSTIHNVVVVVSVCVSVVVAAVVIAVFLVQRRRKHQIPRVSGPKSLPTGRGDRSCDLINTGMSSHTNSLVFADADVVLDVKPLLPHRLELTDLHVVSKKPLASGAFGEVWLGIYGGQQVAIKRMKNQEARMVQNFIDEIVLMSQMCSDYIVKFVGASWTRPIEIECVVEYMDLGDLRSLLVAHPPSEFTWVQKYESIVSIVRGLVYLHTYKPSIIHRDLKSRNVLLDSKKGTKLSDFGTSRAAEEDDTMTNGVGTYQWMAPEVITSSRYSAAADIYSFGKRIRWWLYAMRASAAGIILSELCSHQLPFADMRLPETNMPLTRQYVVAGVQSGTLHPSFAGEDVPTWVADIGMKCLQLREEDRPTALMLTSMLRSYQP
ncbi:protein kinase [Achlya hypogyna]|uniref:Protein kinase n=1 Tax=Achlya hypogyna TaxID=1202772 RepID=A0A1V9ZPG6_ACHHY|nr:protein kinase [Achlya hypogyna]